MNNNSKHCITCSCNNVINNNKNNKTKCIKCNNYALFNYLYCIDCKCKIKNCINTCFAIHILLPFHSTI